ncbi:MAG: putative DNA binding domain-containing protein [Oscillospiraceae bacterium]|uniref:ATP-binding protein n=1 Tax=Ruminococcus sp. TaxID=41978 RepID=UPI0025EC0D67|nr:ATP-binding protein [Ruminococcus sp.]MBQ9209516.1 putative DNA binding domain-containing protein [Oscillospiraceae bacterium]MBR1431005.1 putative DNA binding domain-containing protein [Ruminococcus sp.]
MNNIVSKINPLLTLEYLTSEHENKYFDRKSAKIKVSDLAPHISGFANADGGTLVLGINDKTFALEGINSLGEDKINDLINAPKEGCKPMPKFREEFLDIINEKGKPDRLLLLHIYSSVDQIIRTTKDQTYLRIGDKTKEMLGDNLRNLEYSKSARHFEDEINYDAHIEELDEELLEAYKVHVGAEDVEALQVLRARGFTKEHDGKEYLTNAAVLLFAKNVQRFYPNCRIRFIRYDGSFAKVGTEINIIRDQSIEYPLLKIIDKAKEFISAQLREFTALDVSTGRFRIVPEYPEFAWQEAIVNAVTHREYAMSGNFIKVTMYDDRLEIESPGRLPNVVTLDNIMTTRYSRNPRISRVMTEFGWVRELNEGVKRIYSDMKSFFLDEPVYSEPEESVRLVLKNNIVMRTLRQIDRTEENIGSDIWIQLDDLERTMLTYMMSRGAVKRSELIEHTRKSAGTISGRLKHLMGLGIVKANGNNYDPKRTYEIDLSNT